MIRAVALLLALTCASLVAAETGGDAGEPEIRVKAMFLYNFARFTAWPGEAKSPLTFCILGEDRLERELEPILQGKTVADRMLASRRVKTPAQMEDCRVIYVGKAERNRTLQIVRNVQGKSVLVVSEFPEAGSAGAAINFFLEQDKMRFAVNLTAAANAGVVLSSNLLRLARITGERK